MARFLSWVAQPRRYRLLEIENRALRQEIRSLRTFLDSSLDRVNRIERQVVQPEITLAGSAQMQTHDGWQEIAVAPDGRLAVMAYGEPVYMTVEEAQQSLPDWEFKDEIHQGKRRVMAR